MYLCLQPLDYETAPEHRLNITAQGPGPGVAGGVAHLRLHKDNTLFSLIQLCLYTCLQPLDYESAPEHRLNITIHGAGPWAGVAGGVALDMYENYILLQNNQTFFLLMKVHFFCLQPLDYETMPEHRLNITARDLGLVWRAAWRTYAVRLVDVNDNAPQFNASVFNAFVAEDAQRGSHVITVRARRRHAQQRRGPVLAVRRRRNQVCRRRESGCVDVSFYFLLFCSIFDAFGIVYNDTYRRGKERRRPSYSLCRGLQ